MAKDFDLKHELAFYRKYHSDYRNVLIHIIFVPTILFTTMVQLCNVSIPQPIINKLTFLPSYVLSYANLGMICAIGYGLFYASLDIPFGVPSIPVLVGSAIKLSDIVHSPNGWTYTKWSMYLCATSWIFQFIGHALYEKRSPALLDNLLQALVMAPFFVVFEIAYYLGFRRDIIDQVDAEIKPELEAFRASQRASKMKKAK